MSVIQLTLEAAADKGMAEQWFGLWAALLGAVVGSVVSGLVTFLMQRATRQEASKARSVGLILKMSKIASSLTAVHRQILEGIKEAEDGGAEGDLWQKMVAMTGMSKIHITPEEFSVFVDMKDYDYLNRVLLLDEKQNSIVDTLELYAQKRNTLLDMMPAKKMDGMAGQIEIDDPELIGRIGPKIAETKMIAENLLQMLEEYANEARNLCDEAGPKLRAHYKDKSFPILKSINPAATDEKAAT